jgi:hypothetical protein
MSAQRTVGCELRQRAVRRGQRHGGQTRLKVCARGRRKIADRRQQAQRCVVFTCAQQPLDIGSFGQRLAAQTRAIAPHHQRLRQHALARQFVSPTGIARRQPIKPLGSALLLEQALVEFYRLTIATCLQDRSCARVRRDRRAGSTGTCPGRRCSVLGRHLRKRVEGRREGSILPAIAACALRLCRFALLRLGLPSEFAHGDAGRVSKGHQGRHPLAGDVRRPAAAGSPPGPPRAWPGPAAHCS